MAAIQHVYRYGQASSLGGNAGRLELNLAAELQAAPNSTFFAGTMRHAHATARCLRAVSNVVGTRFYVPPAMLARILAEADPVITVGRDTLRFEGFSACCSTYARLDVSRDGFAAERLSPGTTNVDFGPSMRAALAKVRADSHLALSVGGGAVAMESDNESVIEKKVPLPLRWLKGFAEVQAHQAQMTPRFSMTRVQAQRFFRALPRAPMHRAQWLVAAGRGYRLASRSVENGLLIRGAERLRLLETLATNAKGMTIFGSDKNESSAWVLDFGVQRFNLVLSPQTWRGFSGEGQLLTELSSENTDALAAVKAQLNWQTRLRPDAVAAATGHDSGDVQAAFATLAARGLLGFDIVASAYFHRVLPFDLDLVSALQPRLESARRLLEKGAVKLALVNGAPSAQVRGGDVAHRVSRDGDVWKCTCPWYSRYRDQRGPCKHILATQIMAEKSE